MHTTAGTKLELLQGTLDLMVLQTLDTMGRQHRYGIARRIEQMCHDILKLNEGTVYTTGRVIRAVKIPVTSGGVQA